MKNNILTIIIFLFCLTGALSQRISNSELQEKFWENSGKESKVTEVPEKWKNESVVILYKDEFFKYTNNGRKMYNPSYSHKRIKLLDKAAVENYSEISYDKEQKITMGYYNMLKKKSYIGIKIIKPDGTEKIIDIDKEKVSQDNKNRIAIPNLEVGDILDMYIYNDDFERAFVGFYNYEPIERLINQSEPILYSRFAVEIENDYFLNMQSYNEGPRIKEEPTEKRSTRRFVLEASDIEKIETPRWFYPYVVRPHFKMQVTFAINNSSQNRADVFLDKDDKTRKTSVSNQEIREYFGERFNTDYNKHIKDVLKYLKEKNITDKREQLVEALYFIRHKSFNRFIELVIAKNESISYGFPCGEYIILNDDNFVNYFSTLAKKLEIDYDIIVATADYNGPIENLLLRSNVSHGLRFNFDKPLYFFNISSHVQPDFFDSNLEGTKAYVLSVYKNRKIEDIKTEILPVTTAEQNISEQNVNISFEDNFKKLIINRDLKFLGNFKSKNLNTKMFFNDYIEEEFERYNTSHFYHCKKKQNKREKQEQTKIEAVYKTYIKKHLKNLEQRVGDEFDVSVSDYNYKVINAARYSNKPFEMKDSFTIENQFVKKAGKNFIVEVGKFIGGQVQLAPSEKERKEDVFLNHAKQYKYKVTITIPEGYEVLGLDKLNKNVSNNTGSFVSSAIIKDGKLIFNTRKIYKSKKYNASQWSDMVKWLDAAYDFSQTKIMFKKL